MENWMEYGTLNLESDAATDISKIWRTLDSILSCPLILQEVPKNYFQRCHDPTKTKETTEGELVQIAARAYIKRALPLAKRK